MQSVWNLTFTSIGPVHLAILTHHHHSNITNNIHNSYNNTVSATHIQKKCILSPHSNRSGIIWNNFVSCSPRNIHNSKGDSIQLEGLQRSFLPLMLVILGSLLLSFLLIHTPHPLSLKDNSSFGSVITVGNLPIKAEWLDALLIPQVFS